MNGTFLGLAVDQLQALAISVIVVVVTIVVGRWLVMLIVDQGLRRLVRRSKTGLDDAILDSLRTPLYCLLVIFVIEFSIQRLDFLPTAWESWLSSIFYVLYLATGFLLAGKLLNNVFIWYGKEMAIHTESELDEQLIPFFRRVALVILGGIGFIMLLSHFDIDVSSLVATLGITSLAIALAAQSALADTISGFIIMMDRPFRIGDRIELQDLNTWGDVVDIGLRSSRIRTRDNRMVIVPNSVIGKSLIVNHAYPNEEYRIQIQIGIAYGSDIELARQTIIQAVRGVEGVLVDHPVEVLFLEFGDSALTFRVRWWLESYTDTRRMFDRVNSAIYQELDAVNIDIPYPQQVIHHQFNPHDRVHFTHQPAD
jgi:small-conductance mechanosensitive channel